MNVIEITAERNRVAEKLRLAAYCRVSSNSEDQLHSFAAQIRYYKDYERMHPEYRLVDVYADEGTSGLSMEKRAEFQRLLRDCKRGKIDRIIVKSVSCFARNTSELLTTLRFLKEVGVSVFFEEQGIDSDKLNSEMILTFPGMAAQQESVAISGNMRWSYKKRMESGEFNCCAPAYGFALADGKLIVNEAEASVIRCISDRFLRGLGKQTIANQLNAENVPHRESKKWYAFTIHYILNNERYMGDALLQKFYTTDTLPFRQLKNRGQRQQYYVSGANPAIVSREIYQAAQELQAERQKKMGAKNGVSILRGSIRCRDCGRTYRRYLVGEKAYCICCSKSTGATPCKSHRIPEEAILEAFSRMVFKLCRHRQELFSPLLRDMELLQRNCGENYMRIAQIDSEIADLSARNLVIVRLHTSGILNAADYAAQSADLAAQLTALRSERKRKLSEDEEDVRLDQIRELNDILAEYEPNCHFDEELYPQIVERVIVADGKTLQFQLMGGIMLTERTHDMP